MRDLVGAGSARGRRRQPRPVGGQPLYVELARVRTPGRAGAVAPCRSRIGACWSSMARSGTSSSRPTCSPRSLDGRRQQAIETVVKSGRRRKGLLEPTRTGAVTWRQRRLRDLVLETTEPYRTRRSSSELAWTAMRTYCTEPGPGADAARLGCGCGGGTPGHHDRPPSAGRRSRSRRAYDILDPIVDHAAALPASVRAESALLYARALQILRPSDTGAAKALGIARRSTTDDDPWHGELDFVGRRTRCGIGHYANQRKYLHGGLGAGGTGSPASEPALLGRAGRGRGRPTARSTPRSRDLGRPRAQRCRRRRLPRRDGARHPRVARLELARPETWRCRGHRRQDPTVLRELRQRIPAGVGAPSRSGRTSCVARAGTARRSALLNLHNPDARSCDDSRSTCYCCWSPRRRARTRSSRSGRRAPRRARGHPAPGRTTGVPARGPAAGGADPAASGQPIQAAFTLQDTLDRAPEGRRTVAARRGSRAHPRRDHGLARRIERRHQAVPGCWAGADGHGRPARAGEFRSLPARSRLTRIRRQLFRPVVSLLDDQSRPGVEIELPWRAAAGSVPEATAAAAILQHRDAARVLNRVSTASRRHRPRRSAGASLGYSHPAGAR